MENLGSRHSREEIYHNYNWLCSKVPLLVGFCLALGGSLHSLARTTFGGAISIISHANQRNLGNYGMYTFNFRSLRRCGP